MEHSEHIDQLSAAILEVQKKGLMALDNQQNKHLTSTYADFPRVVMTIIPEVNAAGLTLMQFPGPVEMKGTQVVASITNLLSHPASKQWIRETQNIPIPDPIVGRSGGSVVNLAQRYGSAITYAKRYAVLAIFMIPSGDDDDAANAFPPDRSGVNREQQEPPATWQDLFTTGKWKACPSPYGSPLGDLDRDQLRSLVKQNWTNQGSNPALTAVHAVMLQRVCLKRGYKHIDEVMPVVEWRGAKDVLALDYKGLKELYDLVIPLPAVPEAKETEPMPD